MSISKRHIVLAFLFLLLGFTTVHAQNYEKMRQELQSRQQETRKEIDQLKSQIDSYQQQISATQAKFETLNKEYSDLQNEIALRNKLLGKLKNEQDDIQQEIGVTKKSIAAKEKEYQQLTENYQETLVYLYKHGRDSELALILTSHSLNQMMVRSYYLRKFSEYRQKQLDQIKKVQADLDQKKADLEQSESRNKKVIAETEQEREKLRQRTEQQKKVIAALRRNRSNLEGMLKNVRKQVSTLNNKLTDLIAQEDRIRKAEEQRQRLLEAERRRRLAAARKISDPTKRKAEIAKYSKPIEPDTNVPTDAELDKMQKAFASDKGKLPWPVSQGVIVTHFGTNINPVYRTKIQSLGIDISTPANSPVHAVSDGYVFDVEPLTGYGNLVFVNHGQYKTVYGNLSQVYVRKNTVVHTGDVIGLSGDENSARGKTVFFMIRDGDKNVNPEKWIQKK